MLTLLSGKLTAAFKSPWSGQIFTGATHADAFIASDISSLDAIPESEFLKAEGFVSADGKFLTREESLSAYGISRVEDVMNE